jgi:hypothetical protein
MAAVKCLGRDLKQTKLIWPKLTFLGKRGRVLSCRPILPAARPLRAGASARSRDRPYLPRPAARHFARQHAVAHRHRVCRSAAWPPDEDRTSRHCHFSREQVDRQEDRQGDERCHQRSRRLHGLVCVCAMHFTDHTGLLLRAERAWRCSIPVRDQSSDPDIPGSPGARPSGWCTASRPACGPAPSCQRHTRLPVTSRS